MDNGSRCRRWRKADFFGLKARMNGKMQITLHAACFFNIANKLNMTPIHYKGAGQAVGAVVGGEPKLGCMAITAPLQNIKGGRLKALAVSSAKRLPILPEVPTLSELGHPEMLDYTWVGAFLPAGTPAAIQAKWGSYAAFKEAFVKSAVGNFGSGWTWLVKKADGTVDIVNTGAAGTPAFTSRSTQ